MGPDGLKDWSGGDSTGVSSTLSGADAEKSLLESAKTWTNDLSDNERECIVDYTGMANIAVNEYLRDNHIYEEDEEWVSDAINNLDSAIERFELKENVTMYRGCSSKLLKLNIDENLIGQEYRDLGFMSTAVDKEEAEIFADGRAFDSDSDPVILKIDIPAGIGRGAYLSGLSDFSDEKEFLLKRDSTFEIYGITYNEDGTPILEMRWKE